MLSLILDVETTGIPSKGEVITSPFYPRLVELAALLVEAEREIAVAHLVVAPAGFAIPDEAAAIHGISTARAIFIGVPIEVALAVYLNLRARADIIVGHNLEFDVKLVESEVYRLGRAPRHPGPSARYCTAERGTTACALPPTDRMIAAGFGDRYKKPTLSELHLALFGEPFEGAHGALADARAAARCYFELRRRGA